MAFGIERTMWGERKKEITLQNKSKHKEMNRSEKRMMLSRAHTPAVLST